MPFLKYYAYAEVVVDGDRKKIGTGLDSPKTITVDGDIFDATRSLATGTTWDVLDLTGSENALSDFDFLGVESDQNVFLELTADEGGEVGTVVFAIEIQANVPFLLPSDDCKSNYTADFATGSDDVVDRLRVRNESGSTADVRIFLIT